MMFPKKKRTVPRMVWNAVTRSTHLLMSGVSDISKKKEKGGHRPLFLHWWWSRGFSFGAFIGHISWLLIMEPVSLRDRDGLRERW